jgi:Peptidase family M23
VPAIALAAVLAPAAAPRGRSIEVPSTLAARPPVRHPPSVAPASRRPDPRLVPFVRFHDIRLFLPAVHVVCVCYHEASYEHAMGLQPLGRLERDYNRTKFPRDTPNTAGPSYMIMSSRGRSTPATSAVDLVLRDGTQILAPVDGVVIKARAYRLYGQYSDVELWIRPEDDPAFRVVMIHLHGVRVRPGDSVVQGVTPLGEPRVFPFSSQSAYYVGGHHPHVHLEIVDPRMVAPSG